MKSVKSILLVLATLALPLTASAGPIVFDFEDVNPPAGFPGLTFATSFESTKDGLTMTATWADLAPLHIQEITGGVIGTTNALGTFTNDMSLIPVNVNFSEALGGVTLFFGDFTPQTPFDIDNAIRLEAFSGLDGTGTSLGVATAAWGSLSLLTSNYGSVSLFAPGIRSIRFIGGDDVAGTTQSLYWDNLTAHPVPEPATLLLLGTGLGAVAARCRRRAKHDGAQT